MFRWTTAILILFIFALQSAVGQIHKYGIKSGSVTFERKRPLAARNSRKKSCSGSMTSA